MKIINHAFAVLIALALCGCATGGRARHRAPTPVVIANQPLHVTIDSQSGSGSWPGSTAQSPAASASSGSSWTANTAGTAGTADTPNPKVSVTSAVETPVTSPPLLTAPATTTVPGGTTTDKASIDLSKEILQASKATVPNGSVLIRKTVVTNIVQIPVSVRREEYEVVHVPVSENTPASAFENKEIRMDLSKEVPSGKITGQLVDRLELRKVVKTDQPVVSGQVRTENAEVVPTPASKNESTAAPAPTPASTPKKNAEEAPPSEPNK